MTPEDRRSIVWAIIERMAFRPDAVAPWLALFEQRIHRLWELQPGDVSIERCTSFEVPPLRLICEYRIERAEDYAGSIRLTANQRRLVFTVHSDRAFVSKAGFHTEHRNYPREDHTRSLAGDVQSVLDGMVIHPRNHTHIAEYEPLDSPDTIPPLLPLHEIRVGGGIENAFVFLFHLGYQFCLVSRETRDSERTRLVNLFTTAIKGRETHVPPSKLFDFRR